MISGFRRLAFNTQGELFSNLLMRQAVAYAVDAKAFINEVFWGFGTPAGIRMPPGSKWDIKFPERGPDLAKTKALLQQAGYQG